ncbi:hypothetical protein [Actinoplanes sp. TFC3]|uniref:hypothetical protein n=1 Tax=Actinoplanes sp. TFC3 TaxID=1710355 RepID=UPI00082D3855|nr:hypothetical protein [Actinoplanes sp. TFC3]
MISSPRWLSRYRQGQREVVWPELRQLGSAVRDSEWAPEAQLVCDEMARRAHLPPAAAADAHAAWLQQRFGMVSMTLVSWVRIVGDVWLVGTHPEWERSAAADPLCGSERTGPGARWWRARYGLGVAYR